MSIVAKKNPGSFDLPQEGSFQGVVFAVYDGKLQKGSYNGEEKKQHKIKLGIELNETYTEGNYAGERITRYVEFTLSLSDKGRLLPVIESLLCRALTEDEKENGFDVEKLIGKNCQVTIIHKTSNNGNQYADTKISALMKGVSLMSPKLNPDYTPDFIKKWIVQGEAIEGESISDNQYTPVADNYDSINSLSELILQKYINQSDIDASIFKMMGKRVELINLTEAQLNNVLLAMNRLAEIKSSSNKN
jgi:hypothetical protein